MADKQLALKRAEKEFLSFIHEGNLAYCIKWKCKPFTSFIDIIEVDKLKISISGKITDQQYITTLKENYAQRIANESFSYGYRVGIDLPHLSEDDLPEGDSNELH